MRKLLHSKKARSTLGNATQLNIINDHKDSDIYSLQSIN